MAALFWPADRAAPTAPPAPPPKPPRRKRPASPARAFASSRPATPACLRASRPSWTRACPSDRGSNGCWMCHRVRTACPPPSRRAAASPSADGASAGARRGSSTGPPSTASRPRACRVSACIASTPSRTPRRSSAWSRPTASSSSPRPARPPWRPSSRSATTTASRPPPSSASPSPRARARPSPRKAARSPFADAARGGSKRFSTTLNLAREGLVGPGDLIVQLVARDNRRPRNQVTEGPSVILRRSAALGSADGLDGLLRPVMPAYFASQRQIIIDAEALVAERGDVEPRQFLDRSNGFGVDQARLRLRYGQFLGEEAEGGGLSLPTNDAPALPTNDTHDHDHDHAPEPEPEVHSPRRRPRSLGRGTGLVRLRRRCGSPIRPRP